MTWPSLHPSMVVAHVVGRSVVLDQRSGVLVQLDDVAAFVLEHRAKFHDVEDAARAIAEVVNGDPRQVALDLQSFASHLATLGSEQEQHLAPRRRDAELPLGTPLIWLVDVLGTPVEVRCYGARLASIVPPLLAALPAADAPAVHRFDVWGDDRISVAQDGALSYDAVSTDQAINGLIAGLTAIAFFADRHGVAVHAAAVADNGRVVVLGGASNQGKSTTTIELVERGFDFVTDEIIELDPASGLVRGLARPLGLEGPMQARRSHLRPSWLEDADSPRWAVPPSDLGDVVDSGLLAMFCVLEFVEPVDAAYSREFDPLEAVSHLCALTFNRAVLTPPALGALGELLRSVPTFLIRHHGAADAAAQVRECYGRTSAPRSC